MAKFYVRYKVTARYEVEVEAESIKEARQISESSFEGADFGEATDIEGVVIAVENENGDFVYER